LHYSYMDPIPSSCAMPFADALFTLPLTAMPFSQLLMSLVHLTLLGGLLMFFRPLLTGIARALVLLVRPHPGRRAIKAKGTDVHSIAASS
jgi:ABC-type Co2+ transport system permease subunit